MDDVTPVVDPLFAGVAAKPESSPKPGAVRVAAARDLDREALFLAAAGGGRSAFFAQATGRLRAGQAVYGDGWAARGVEALVGELLEESADLGAWAALADQALDAEQLSPGERQRMAAVLALVAAHGAQAHALLSGAMALTDDCG
jgi:hypothetical protein